MQDDPEREGLRAARGRGRGRPRLKLPSDPSAGRDQVPGREALGPDEETLLLLAVRGPMPTAQVAASLDLPGPVVASTIGQHAAAGLVEFWTGDRVRLTGGGIAAATAVLARERSALGTDTESIAERFDELNRRVKAAITDWQVVRVAGAVVPNDHSDAKRDAIVVARLASAVGTASVLLRPLARLRRRIAVLLGRLEGALGRVSAGGGDWVCGLGVDSVHAVWWNLHAELLALLGRERGDADA